MAEIKTYILDIARLELPCKPADATRILLFSDIHLGIFPSPFQMFNKRVLGAFNHLLRRRHKIHPENISRLAGLLPDISPDIIVCAGDLSSVALPSEFELATEALKPFRDRPFFYVPGNHDAYVKSALPYLQQTFSELNGKRWNLDELPVAVDCDNVTLHLINAARPVAYHLSCGVIDAQMKARLEELNSKPSDRPRIAVCHFPAVRADGSPVGWRHGLRGADSLSGRLFNGEYSAVLSGHVHTPYVYRHDNGCTQLCSGSLTLKGSFAICDIINK